VVTLLPDTYYVICGTVNIGPNRIEVPPSSVLAGKDPLVDTITADPLPIRDLVSFPQGGTIRDLALAWPVRAAAVQFGVLASPPAPPAANCVAWNLSILNPRDGVAFRGLVGFATVSRITARNVERTIYQAPGPALGDSAIGALYATMIASESNPAGAKQILLQGVSDAVACSAMVVADSDPTAIGIDIPTPARSLQFWGCAFDGNGIPSSILDPNTGALLTTGTAAQSESVAMVGYDNSTTRGSISVFQPGGGVATITPVGSYVPVGNGAPAHPLYALGSSSVRFTLISLGGAPGADVQVLEYVGIRPYVGSVTLSLSVALAGGFITTPRAIGARLLLNGAVLPDATWEGGFAPGAIAVTAGSLSFATGITLQSGDQLQIEIANLGIDPGNLVVTGAEVSVS
jgi:hypothetical protein